MILFMYRLDLVLMGSFFLCNVIYQSRGVVCLYCVNAAYEDKKGSGGITSSLVIFKNNTNKYCQISQNNMQ